MSDRDDENLRNAILKKKALLAHKESILSRPPITTDSRGVVWRASEGHRIRLHEECQQLQQSITEHETEMLLRRYRRSIDPLTRNAVAQAAIAQQLAERGFYVQGMGQSTAAEVRSETHLSSARTQKGRPRNKLKLDRQEIIAKVSAQGFEGEEYCNELLRVGLSTPIRWQKDENCPIKYPDAYSRPNPTERKKWRQRIANEKYQLTKAYKKYQATKSLESETSPLATRNGRVKTTN